MSAKELKDSSIPLYQQVANDLRSSIENDIYRSGQRIPPEPELSQLYGVSRITVRKAIQLLVDEGYLMKRQGKGTFVNQQEAAQKICDDRSAEVLGFSASCRANGLVPGAHLLTRGVVETPSDEREQFKGESKVISIERVRTADGEPIMAEFNLFPQNGLEFLLTEPLEDVSLFALISERTGRHAMRNSTQLLSIVLADERLSKILEVPVGEPLFYLQGHYCDQHGELLYAGRQYMIGSRYTFSM